MCVFAMGSFWFKLLPQKHNLLNELLSKVAKVVLQPLNLISFQSIQMDHMGHLQITLHSLENIPEAFCCPPTSPLLAM